MTLSEAYKLLGFSSPLKDYDSPQQTGGLGTSMHTLTEMYLDQNQVLSDPSIGLSQAHKAKFIYLCLSEQHAQSSKKMWQQIHEALNLIQIQTQFFPYKNSFKVFQGEIYPSWGVFCDHAVKESISNRIAPPFSFIRSFNIDSDGNFDAYDRDKVLVCKMTEKGAHDLIDRSPCPITIKSSKKVAPITYPAWSKNQDPDFNLSIRMLNAWSI